MPDTTSVGMKAAVLALGQFCVVAAFQSTAIVLPAIGQDLQVDPAALSWLVSAVALSYGGLLPVAGRLADRFGPGRTLGWGAAALAVFAMLALVAPSFPILLSARILQGAAMAVYTPAMVALLRQAFDDEPSRRRALVWWNAAGGVGGVIAVVAGGAVAGWLGWRPVLLLVALPALATALGSRVAFRSFRASTPSATVRPLGGILTSMAAAAVILTMTVAQSTQDRLLTVASVGVAAVLVLAWCRHELRSREPIVPRRLRNWWHLQPVAIAVLHGAAINTPIFFYSLFAQDQLRLDPFLVGLGFLPCNIGLLAGSVIGGAVHRRLGSVACAVIGLAAVALGLGLLLPLSDQSNLWLPFAPAFVVYGAGANIGQIGFLALAGERAPEAAGTLGGLVTAGGQLGTAVGLALLTGIASIPAGAVDGIRLAFAGAAGLALLGLLAAVVPRRSGRGSARPGRGREGTRPSVPASSSTAGPGGAVSPETP